MDEGETWAYEWVDQKTETETVNVYVVIMGQAVVVKSETKSWACDEEGKAIEDEDKHGYRYMKGTVEYTYNERGQLVGAVGMTEREVERWR